jgi:homopolymeric O-antigen transport system ATP-binding protein
MSDIAIRAEGLSKEYHIGKREDRHLRLRDVLVEAILSPFRRLRDVMSGNAFAATDLGGRIWALRDVHFEIKRGESVGLIGRNGSGKSTLLRVLSRITEPTDGYGDIYGRVGSLLEVGTGFHPELTGQENIYLNGAILGMRRAEIDRRFDEIVAFSEIDKFIDTPVKHYSSGMYLRLAFAVAAHLETELLLVDEVLAVGDSSFQRKCLGKMDEVARRGRTIVFVSHNLGAITRLCQRCLWLEDGRLKMDGPASSVVAEYLRTTAEGCPSWKNPDPPQHDDVQVTSARLLLRDRETMSVDFTSDFEVEVGYVIARRVRELVVLCRMIDTQGNVVWTSWDTDKTSWRGLARERGVYLSTCKVTAGLLRPGRYTVTVGAIGGYHEAGSEPIYDSVLAFDVSPVGYPLNKERIGIVTPLLDWEVAQADKRVGAEVATDPVPGT